MMTRRAQLDFLLGELMPHGANPPSSEADKWQMFRTLVNLRPPEPISTAFLQVQDELLKAEIQAKGITQLSELKPVAPDTYLWQGDITTLAVEAIVNAANSGLTGCYCPCHGCIDNAIHTYAGVQLRNACAEIMRRQGHAEPIGQAKLTSAYNLPSRYIMHTVGPIVNGPLTRMHREQLASCYRACLQLADEKHLTSIAFCCISTGEFRFPHAEAAQIAWHEVAEYHKRGGQCQVVFNVFGANDLRIYHNMLIKGKP